MKTDHLLIGIAIIGLGWVAWARHQAAPFNFINTLVPAGLPVQASNNLSNVPWYLTYNTTPPYNSSPIDTLPQNSVGIENTTKSPCSLCSLFGDGYSASY